MATTVNASNTPIKVSTSIGSTRVVSSTTTQSQVATATELGDLTGIDVSGKQNGYTLVYDCLLYTSPSPRDGLLSRMPSSA